MGSGSAHSVPSSATYWASPGAFFSGFSHGVINIYLALTIMVINSYDDHHL